MQPYIPSFTKLAYTQGGQNLSELKNDIMMLVLKKKPEWIAFQEHRGEYPVEVVEALECRVNTLLRKHFPNGSWVTDPFMKNPCEHRDTQPPPPQGLISPSV